MRKLIFFVLVIITITSLNTYAQNASNKNGKASVNPTKSSKTQSGVEAGKAKSKSKSEVNTEDLINSGKLAVMSKNYQKAEEFFTKAIQNDKEESEAYSQRGLCYVYMGRFDKAAEDLSVAIKLTPNYSDNYNIRGLAYSYMNELDKAVDDFNKAIKLDPSYHEAYLNRASCYITQNKFDEAKADFKKIAKQSESNPEFFIQRARLSQLLGEYESAVKDYSKVLDLGIKNVKIYYNRANAYFKNNDFQNAIKDYTVVLKADSNDVDALNNRAIAYEKIDKGPLALDDRARIEAYYDRMRPNLDSMKLRTFIDSSARFSIDAPPDWHAASLETDSTIHFYLTQEPMNGQCPVLHAMAITYVKRMPFDYKGTTDADLIDYWDKYTRSMVLSYGEYNIYSTKKGPWEGWSTVINHVKIAAEKGATPFHLFEFCMVRQGTLIFGNLQAPEEDFLTYYQYFYEKVLKTIKTISKK